MGHCIKDVRVFASLQELHPVSPLPPEAEEAGYPTGAGVRLRPWRTSP